MQVTRWTSIKAVLSDLEDTLSSDAWSEADVVEWCALALDKLHTYYTLEYKEDLLVVDGHKAKLPKGLIRINQIGYKKFHPHESHSFYESIRELFDESSFGQACSIDKINDKLACKVIKDNWSSHRHLNCFKPLKLNVDHFSMKIHSDCQSCLDVDCEDSYRVLPNGCIQTSFSTGTLLISYLRYPLEDCTDDFLIPDMADYIDALKSYVMMRIWERRWNMKEEGSDQRFKYYQTKWNYLQGKIRAMMMMPDIDELENIRRMRNRMIPVSARWSGFFGNLNTTEQVITKGFYSRDSEMLNNHRGY